MEIDQQEFADFLELSAALTGHPKVRLLGTGLVSEYFTNLDRILGRDLFKQFLGAYSAVVSLAGTDEVAHEHLVRQTILGNERLGPIARNLIKLWYVGVWYRLPSWWHEQFSIVDRVDRDCVFSSLAYTEALLWPTIGTNPPGAKGPGFGSWSEPPHFTSS